jgi:ribonuclease P protein component
MRRSSDFTSVVNGGARARGRRIVVHQGRDLGPHPARVGLVISKAVGGSVVRHRVARRLRAQVALRLDRLAEGSGTVVRALPAAALASSVELGRSLDEAFDRLAARR